MSSCVVNLLRLKRMEERAAEWESPMFRRMREGSRPPEAHADPRLTAIPARSSCINRVSASTPGKWMFEVLQMRGPKALIWAVGYRAWIPFSKFSFKARICKEAFGSSVSSSATASAKPMMPIRFSVPDL